MVEQTQIKAFVDKFNDRVKVSVPLARYSVVGVGGAADLLVDAQSRDDLVQAVNMADALGLPWRVFGGLTNVLLPDDGLRGVVIVNNATSVTFDEPNLRVCVESGKKIVSLARTSVNRGWGGLTWAVGLPGTVGGAVVNNAGAFGGEISKALYRAEVFSVGASPRWVEPDWFDFKYRCSKLKGAGYRWLVTAAEFQLRLGDLEYLTQKATEYTERRGKTQPPGKTLGSTFKNPEGDYAGRLIEMAGLKGSRVGGFVVSTHHANFFINEGNGTACDFITLLQLVQDEVYRKFGVHLESEIEIVSE
ncbi:MAG: UDP-N-acetylmuramate dehydrogenase [Anaerolineae bacterium]|nr:UDP-N-acetylmuramate dehydrogenase [Anaerolineae bacterium]